MPKERPALVKEGADFIKVMGSGGGTYITQPRLSYFTVDELKVIVSEAHRHERRTTVHVLATQSIIDALDAGFDCLEHVEFVETDWSRKYHPEIGTRIADSGCWVSPTIMSGHRRLQRLLVKRQVESLTSEEQALLTSLKIKIATNFETVGRLYDMKVPMVVGNGRNQRVWRLRFLVWS